MKRGWIILLCTVMTFMSFAQQLDIQRVTYNENNSSLPTSVCYNWNQITNGSFFVSGNAGIYRFDGVNFHQYPTQGRGLAISSSVEDKNGRLWCNSFHGDIYYLKKGEMVRHPISKSIRGLTTFRVVNKQLYLFTENKLFKFDVETLAVEQIGEYYIIRELFERNNRPYLLVDSNDGRTQVIDIEAKASEDIKYDFAKGSACRFIQSKEKSYLFFISKRKIIGVNDFFKGDSSQMITLNYQGKINYITEVDENFAVSGMNGINIYSKRGKTLKKLLPDVQVTHFGKDQEGNYVATSMSEGLILIPDMNVFRKDLSVYFKHENIIHAVFDTQQYLYLGTNAGQVLRLNLWSHKVDTLHLGLRSEVLSMHLSATGDELYVYCDALFTVDVSSFRVKQKRSMSSVKKMTLFNGQLMLGTRKGVELFDGNDFHELAELGWVISMLPLEERNELLVASKNGLFRFDMSNRSFKQIQLKGVNSDQTISSIIRGGENIYLISDRQTVYKCSENLSVVKEFYKHDKNDLNGMSFQNDRLYLFSKGEVVQLNAKGDQTISLTSLHGLNEPYAIHGFNFNESIYFVHKKSISKFDALPQQIGVRPVISFELGKGSTFRYVQDGLTSRYKENELVFRFNIRRALRSRGNLDVYYCFDLAERNWKKIDNPYSEVRLERLPMGSGNIYFKAINERGIASEIITVPYYVQPPFYFTIWFLGLMLAALVIIVLIITKWRVQLVRKKTLERLKKEKLESRALNAELTAIRSQMNPHFIFNVLTAIQAKVIEGKIDEAYENIGDFAVLIRNVLEKSGQEFISLDDEIALMQNYVELENSRLSRPIRLEIRLEDSNDLEDVFIPTLITQPLIENSIKHAFNQSNASPQIVLEAKSIPEGFSLAVSDNGSGFDREAKSQEHDSFALSALRKRIQTLSKTAPYTIDLAIESDHHGTEVVFVFKYK